MQASTIKNEQDLLVFHIQTLQAIFSKRILPHLTPLQQQTRLQHLKVLAQYAQLRDCPRNYNKTYRTPVFIDEKGRYCAVGYLMLHSGKKNFCEAVQKTNNYIYIRQIENQEFSEWQQSSGLSLDELAWIQPAYSPVVKLVKWNPQTLHKTPVFLDSVSTARIYLPEYDHRDIFRLSRIFWGTIVSLDEVKEIAKTLIYQPNWDSIPNDAIKCAKVYREELYISFDSSSRVAISENDYQDKYYSCVYKWSKSQKWELVLDLSYSVAKNTGDLPHIYSLFEYAGKLYAGGGDTDFNSYLAVLENEQWKEIKQNFGGYVFGIVYKNKQTYLGITHPPDGFR
ncbi:MAG: hypothetical protein MUE85_09960 [Microscillaceae bacterium]|nr:hypothetical protein [Microscillaceae bacterium]